MAGPGEHGPATWLHAPCPAVRGRSRSRTGRSGWAACSRRSRSSLPARGGGGKEPDSRPRRPSGRCTGTATFATPSAASRTGWSPRGGSTPGVPATSPGQAPAPVGPHARFGWLGVQSPSADRAMPRVPEVAVSSRPGPFRITPRVTRAAAMSRNRHIEGAWRVMARAAPQRRPCTARPARGRERQSPTHPRRCGAPSRGTRARPHPGAPEGRRSIRSRDKSNGRFPSAARS